MKKFKISNHFSRSLQSLALVLLSYFATVHLAANIDFVGEPISFVTFIQQAFLCSGILVVLGLTFLGLFKIYDN